MQKPTTIEEAFKALGLERPSPEDFSHIPERFRDKQIATYEGQVVVAAINGDWKADYGDHNQEKWYPVCYQEEGTNDLSGFRFLGADYDYADTYRGGGSHLVFSGREDVIHYITHFLELIWRIQVGN